MESSQQLILTITPLVVILALFLILLQTAMRRKKRGVATRWKPSILSVGLYAIGVIALVYITYGPEPTAFVRNIVLGLFILATAILVLSIVRSRQ